MTTYLVKQAFESTWSFGQFSSTGGMIISQLLHEVSLNICQITVKFSHFLDCAYRCYAFVLTDAWLRYILFVYEWCLGEEYSLCSWPFLRLKACEPLQVESMLLLVRFDVSGCHDGCCISAFLFLLAAIVQALR